jgi:hypothetical protein
MLKENNERQQLIKMVGSLLDGFGSMGHYKKGRFTPTGRERKNNEYVYPHKYELLGMFKRLHDNDYDAREIHTRYLGLKKELIEKRSVENEKF